MTYVTYLPKRLRLQDNKVVDEVAKVKVSLFFIKAFAVSDLQEGEPSEEKSKGSSYT